MTAGAGAAVGAPLPPDPESAPIDRLRLALHAAARPLIALAMPLRQAVGVAPQTVRPALESAVARFERELTAAGWDARGVATASYVVCTWIDELVANTPWGADGPGLLERFHGERAGGGRVLRLLSALADQPHENRALLELFHVCLGLGLTGSLRDEPDVARQRDALRRRVFRALGTEAAQPPALSPAWHSAAPPAPPGWRRHAAVGALLALALVALGVYTACRLALASQVDEVFVSMQHLAPPVATPPAASAPAVERLAPPLVSPADPSLSVRDEPHRSVVVLPADALFASPAGRLTPEGEARVARVGAVLATMPGKVVVIGHSDGSDARTASLPSAWHQSYAWARDVASALARALPPDRLAVEGAGEIDDDAAVSSGAPPPRRRVDVVLYP